MNTFETRYSLLSPEAQQRFSRRGCPCPAGPPYSPQPGGGRRLRPADTAAAPELTDEEWASEDSNTVPLYAGHAARRIAEALLAGRLLKQGTAM